MTKSASASTPTAHCRCFDVPFRLSADTSVLLEKMKDTVPFGTCFVTDASDAMQQFALSRIANGFAYSSEERPELECPELAPILEQLRSDLMIHIANHTPHRVFLHAGVVVRNGRALLLPGSSYAGKTTLVAELVRAGATYYSDEYAVLDELGNVHPYARTLQMREPGGRTQTVVAVETLNGLAGTEPVPVALVIFAEYDPKAEWLPKPLTAGVAVLEMLRHSIPVQRTPARVMAILSQMMETASAWRSQRGEAHAVATVLLTMLDNAQTASS